VPVKHLRTKSKIFFPDPYVVRVEYGSEYTEATAYDEYKKLTRLTYKTIQGTWGYSDLQYEVVRAKGNNPSPAITPAHNAGLIINTMGDDFQVRYRGYFCFKDEIDALQFRLSLSTIALQVYLIPQKTLFTIHEVVEDES